MDPAIELKGYHTKRYERHGLLRIDLNQLDSVPTIPCTLDLTPLQDIAPPVYYWTKKKRADEMPLVLVASDRCRSIPDDALRVDGQGRLKSLDLKIDNTSHSESVFEMKPVYDA